MSVEAEKHIRFKCEKCGKLEYAVDALECALWKGVFVNSDRVDCEKCGHTNHVYIPTRFNR